MKKVFGFLTLSVVFIAAQVLSEPAFRGNPDPEEHVGQGEPTVEVLPQEPPPTDEVAGPALIANQEIEWGTKISEPEKLFTQVWLGKGERPKRAVTSFEQVQGKYVVQPIGAHCLLSESHIWQPLEAFTESGQKVRLEVPSGRKPVCIRVDLESAWNGPSYIPYSRCDVMLRHRIEGQMDLVMTRLVENVLVIGGTDVLNKGRGVPQVDLVFAVTDEQAQKLAASRGKGSFHSWLHGYVPH